MPGLRRQFERPAVVDAGFDRGFVQVGTNISTEAATPLLFGGLRIGCLARSIMPRSRLGLNVEVAPCTQHIVAILAEVVAPLLVQRTDLR